MSRTSCISLFYFAAFTGCQSFAPAPTPEQGARYRLQVTELELPEGCQQVHFRVKLEQHATSGSQRSVSTSIVAKPNAPEPPTSLAGFELDRALRAKLEVVQANGDCGQWTPPREFQVTDTPTITPTSDFELPIGEVTLIGVRADASR